jgi:hypothetical protein
MKEMIFDFRKKKDVVNPVVIKGETIEIVTEYKYLGVLLENKLTWSNHVDAIFKETQSRLFFLRKLRSFNVNSQAKETRIFRKFQINI